MTTSTTAGTCLPALTSAKSRQPNVLSSVSPQWVNYSSMRLNPPGQPKLGEYGYYLSIETTTQNACVATAYIF